MKKLLHPLIPLLVLLVLGGKFIYEKFLEEKYNEKQLVLLEKTKTDAENVSNVFFNVAEKSIRSADNCFSEMGNFDRFLYKTLIDKAAILLTIHSRYLEKINKPVSELENKIKFSTKEEKQKFYNQHFSIEDLNIQTLFQEYIQEIIKIDTLIAQKYQNYTFQKGQSNEELTDTYLNGKSIEIFIHVAKIKAELAYLNSTSISLLAEEYGYFNCTDQAINNIVVPIVSKPKNGKSYVSIVEIAPFMDSTRKNIATKEHFQTNVKYHIDKKGFFVIDEQDFDIKNLQLKWFPDINHNDNHKRIYLEYGKEGRKYEE